ncbi:MAG: NADPH-dependent 7-cyano-7-deazaguanine reductase QueF [Gammaproteobacteria bacterium]|nr:NADPH-dependent 7-cyano-7-deazaguanine reductase QueF [Gammaproteobacteria bacterium]
MNSTKLPLGKVARNTGTYTPSLLYAIERANGRDSFDLPENLPFGGEDIWTCYELSWLNERGKPQIAGLRIKVRCTSHCLVESKSLKLYLNSFAQTKFANKTEVLNTLDSDLTVAFRAPVMVELLDNNQLLIANNQFPGTCLDELETEVTHYQREPTLLRLEEGDERMVKETLFSHLFRSLCPVTGQPDWASVMVQYVGRPIVRESLLKYLVSFRNHAAFHEATIEQIFLDLKKYCRCEQLSVLGCFLRRGGIDINPFRSDVEEVAPLLRLPRQ